MSVAVARDESYAIVTSATRLDPMDPSKIVPTIGSRDRLKIGSPQVVQRLTAGAGATTVRIAPDGALALVANRTEGTVSILPSGPDAGALRQARSRNPKSGPSGIAFTGDGKTALLSRDGDSMISVLHIEGRKIEIDPRPLTAGLRPIRSMSTPTARWRRSRIWGAATAISTRSASSI